MKISEIKNERLGESVFCGEHPSGLKVFVLPKKDYESAFALYGVKYGSIDTSIMKENGEEEAKSMKPFPRARRISLSISSLRARI